MSPAIMGAQALVPVFQGLGVVGSLLALKTFMDQEAAMAPPPYNPCPTCNGTRRVPCMCSRWSDGDSGCGTCRGSGMMTCGSCGGSGTGRQLPARVQATSRQQQGRGFLKIQGVHSSTGFRITPSATKRKPLPQ